MSPMDLFWAALMLSFFLSFGVLMLVEGHDEGGWSGVVQGAMGILVIAFACWILLLAIEASRNPTEIPSKPGLVIPAGSFAQEPQ